MFYLIMKKFYLPKHILIKIYSYDPTYYEHFNNFVKPFLEREWFIKWTCKKTGSSGIDLCGVSGLKTVNKDMYTEDEFKYTYKTCKEICKYRNEKYKGYNHEQEHLKLGSLKL